LQLDNDRLAKALAAIGADEELREEFLRALRAAEERLGRRDFNVREEVSGPVTDALHAGIDSVTVRLSNGLVFECPYRSRIARDVALRRTPEPDHIFEPQTTKLLLHLARNARNVLIGGAYAGDHTIMVAREVAPHGGVVHAFEPNPELFAMLLSNLERNGIRNVRANALALWSRSDESLSLSGGDAWGRVERAETDSGDALRSISIDDYGKRAGVESFDVIMLDIEGAEFEALRGAGEYLRQPAPLAPNIIYEINRSYVDWTPGLLNTEFVRFLTGVGYTSFGVRDYQDNVALPGVPVELVPLDGVYLEGPPHGFNLLGVKDAALVDDPAFRVVPGVSPKYLRHRDPRFHAPLDGASLVRR
jgi:FkbM family methyltransferase